MTAPPPWVPLVQTKKIVKLRPYLFVDKFLAPFVRRNDKRIFKDRCRSGFDLPPFLTARHLNRLQYLEKGKQHIVAFVCKQTFSYQQWRSYIFAYKF